MTIRKPVDVVEVEPRNGFRRFEPVIDEIRSIRAMELRAVTDGTTKKLTGYAAVFNSPSEDMGGWVEVIKPGAFKRSLAEKQDVLCVFNHDSDRLLGRVKSGTLTLAEDARGLKFECVLPDTQEARDVAALVERGDVSGCSFRFRVRRFPDGTMGATWIFTEGAGQDVRELLDVELYDVGPVTEPAYPATDIALRSREEARSKAKPAAVAPSAMAKAWLDLEALT